MFDKPKGKTEATPKISVLVNSIPEEFYAGANPVVKFKNVEREVDLGKRKASLVTSSEKKLLDKTTAAGGGKPLHPANLLANRKFLIIAAAVLFAVALAGAGVYYWRLASGNKAPAAAPLSAPPSAAVPPAEPVITEVTSTPTETPASTVTSTPPVISLETASLEFPSLLLSDSADADSDRLADAEEELFETDPAVADTDKDGYQDSHEVYNLYNPAGYEPMKLIDSGLVKDFNNPMFGYKVYYPVTWAVGNVDPDYRDMLFSTLTGENIEIRVFDKQPGQSFADWFAIWAPGERFSDLVEFSSVFKEQGLRRRDYLTYYFEDQNRIYAIVFHTTDSNVVNYRTIIKMMARSFRLNGNTNAIPLQLNPEGIAAPAAVAATSSPSLSTTTRAATSTL